MSVEKLHAAIELEALRADPALPPPAPAPSASVIVLATFLSALGLAGTTTAWVMVKNEQRARAAAAMEHGALAYRELVDVERTSLLALGEVLAEDARVRSTLSVADVDAATIVDVLADLRKTTGLVVVGALDASGRVRAIAGAAELEKADLGSTTVVRGAREKDGATADLWTLKDVALAVTVTPVRLASGARAHLLLGAALPTSPLGRLAANAGLEVMLQVGDAASFATAGLSSPERRAAALSADKRDLSQQQPKTDVLSEGPTPIRVVWTGPGSGASPGAGSSPIGATWWVVVLAPLLIGVLGGLGLWRASESGVDRWRESEQ